MLASPEQVAALDAALASASSSYRVTGACLGEGPAAMIEISFMLHGERQQSWDFHLDGTPVRKRSALGVVSAVSECFTLALQKTS